MRHLLPILQTLLYCGLVWWGLHERYPARVLHRPLTLTPVQEGAGVQWDPIYIDGPPPTGFVAATCLNLPALLPALLLILPLSFLFKDVASFGSDVIFAVGFGVFVPLLWYAVGWWADSRLGRFPPALFTPQILLQRILAALTLLISAPLLYWERSD